MNQEAYLHQTIRRKIPSAAMQKYATMVDWGTLQVKQSHPKT